MSFDPWSQLEFITIRLASLRSRRRVAERAGDAEAAAELAAEIAVGEATRTELAAWILAHDAVVTAADPASGNGAGHPVVPIGGRPRRVT